APASRPGTPAPSSTATSTVSWPPPSPPASKAPKRSRPTVDRSQSEVREKFGFGIDTRSESARFFPADRKQRENFLPSAVKPRKINGLRAASRTIAGKFFSLPWVLAGNQQGIAS